MPLKKKIIFTLISLILSGFFTFLALEITLRFLPVPTTLKTQAVTFDDPVAHFSPNRDFIWSKDWNFSLVNKGHINNVGFVNDQDYDTVDLRPLFAIIGDSYVESVMVPYSETLHGRLAEKYINHRIYSFGMSGGPLSQYLIWAQHAQQTYRPHSMAFVIVGNDFDESLPNYMSFPAYHQFLRNEDGILQLSLQQEYYPSPLSEILKLSAVVRYAFFNLNARHSWSKVKQILTKKNDTNIIYEDNTKVDSSKKRLIDSKEVIDRFFDLLPSYSGLNPSNISFIIDAPRVRIYKPETQKQPPSYFIIMRNYMIKKARQKGYTVIDLMPIFSAHYAEYNQKFEYDTDWHWSGIGHGVAANHLEKTPMFQKFLGEAATQ